MSNVGVGPTHQLDDCGRRPRATPSDTEKHSMFGQRYRKFVVAGALLALVPFVSRAQEDAPKKGEPIPAPIKIETPPGHHPAPPSSACPQTCKVRVCEMVQETREVVKTTYKQECREEW